MPAREPRQHRWYEPYAYGFGGGAILGLLYAVIFRPTGQVSLTDSWSYVPRDDWWLHAIVVGATVMLVYAAIVVGYRLVAVLFRYNVLFTVGGLLLVVAGAFFLGQAIWADESPGGRVAWTVMGTFVAALGVPMVVTERRAVGRQRDVGR